MKSNEQQHFQRHQHHHDQRQQHHQQQHHQQQHHQQHHHHPHHQHKQHRHQRQQQRVYFGIIGCESILSSLMIFLLKVSTFRSMAAAPSTTATHHFIEEKEINLFIGEFSENMKDSDKQNITFKIIQQSLNSKYPDKIQSDYFRVDERTGYLYSNKVIDRELICSGASQCTITLSMMMILGGHVKTGTVAIEIMDINDNAPQFPHPVFYCNISESAEPNIAKLEIPSAKDADSYQFNIRNFYLEPSNTVFDLHSEEVNGEFNLKLILRTALDRETTNQYNFTVHAVDRGEKMGSMKVIVNVLDANDNAPIFEKQEEYFKLVKEDTAVGTVLVKVEAHDLDEGKNGEIVYKFIDHAHKEFENLFKIDNRTGEIILNDTLDFERTQTYRLSVTARDLGPDALLTHTTVVIKVEDVNDNAPRIKLNSIHTSIDAIYSKFKDEKNFKSFGKKNQKSKNDVMDRHNGRVEFSSGYHSSSNNTAFSVFENKDVVQFVAHVSVTDADSGDNAKTSCYLKETFDLSLYPRHESKFKLDQLYDADFKLVTSPGVRFDREDIDYYTVTIICRDHGMPPLTSSIQQLVAVIDENDNEPYFTDDQPLLLVYENKPIGTEVGRIKARDLDAGLNSQIKFSLEGQKEVLELVEIDPSSGFLRTKNLIDRELISELDLLVVVHDSGSPPRSASLKITIQILDEDDEGPIFSKNKYTFDVKENQPVGTNVGYLTAVDADQAPNNVFYYALENNEFAHVFSLNASSGLLKTNEILDREKYSSYYLIVLANSGNHSDIHKPKFISKTNVIINVKDVNDNRPQYVYPLYNDTIHISNLSPAGSLVIQLKALDLDYEKNAEMSFFIISGNDDSKFRIDQTTNNLIVARSLENIKHEEIVLTLQVKDHGEPSLSSYTDVKIIISDKILTNEHLLNGGSLFGFNTAAELLADETVAIALAVLLAVILVLISIFTLVIWLFGVGRKRRLESYNGHERKNVTYKNKETKAEDCQQAIVTSLSANGRAETTVAHSSSIEKELKMDLTNVLTDDAKTTSNHQVLNMSEACAKPVVMFVKDQHNHLDVHHRENKNGNKDKFFKINWMNKTPPSDVDDKRMKNHVVNTDWYMNPIVNAADSTLSRPDKAQHYQSDLIEFNSGFSNFSLLKPFLLNENFSSPKYLPQNREFERWLDDI